MIQPPLNACNGKSAELSTASGEEFKELCRKIMRYIHQNDRKLYNFFCYADRPRPDNIEASTYKFLQQSVAELEKKYKPEYGTIILNNNPGGVGGFYYKYKLEAFKSAIEFYKNKQGFKDNNYEAKKSFKEKCDDVNEATDGEFYETAKEVGVNGLGLAFSLLNK
eukprot:gene33009-39927_t